MERIAIVSNNEDVQATIQAKLVLLRSDDTVILCKHSEIVKKSQFADIIILHCPMVDDVTLATITNLKNADKIVLLLVDAIEPNSILNAYDAGVCDFFKTDITKFELLIKIINAKKMMKNFKTVKKLQLILRNQGEMKQNADIYTKIGQIVNPDFMNEIFNAPMLLVNIAEENIEKAEQILPKILRESDFIINYEPTKYLIILTQTEMACGKNVFDKLNSKIPMKGVLLQYKGEMELERLLDKLEIVREGENVDFYVHQETSDEASEDWLNDEISFESPKVFKLFKNAFIAKMENVVAPAFYRTKQKFDLKLKNTKIKYFTDENSAEFLLINFDKTNSFKISYTNSAKVELVKTSSIEEKEMLPLSHLTIQSLCKLLEDYILSFDEVTVE